MLAIPKTAVLCNDDGNGDSLVQMETTGHALKRPPLFSSVPEPFIESCENGKSHTYDGNGDLATGNSDDDQREGACKLKKKNY